MMMGTSCVLRRVRVTSNPSSPGNITSTSTTSAGRCSNAASPSSPLPVSATVYPSLSRNIESALRMLSSSSITSMRAPILPSPSPHDPGTLEPRQVPTTSLTLVTAISPRLMRAGSRSVAAADLFVTDMSQLCSRCVAGCWEVGRG